MTDMSIHRRRSRERLDYLRHAAAASGIAVLAVGALAAQLTGAQPAHADQIVSANDLCSSYRPGYVVKLSVSSVLPTPICAAWNAWMPGINDNSDGRLIPGTFPGLPAGSHQVNPWDPFSAWVIPGCGGLECN
jgi:hypothetical protein